MFPVITKYEKVRLLATRANEISRGAQILTDVKDLINPIDIALKEFMEGKIPLCIIRTLPNGKKYKVCILDGKENKEDEIVNTTVKEKEEEDFSFLFEEDGNTDLYTVGKKEKKKEKKGVKRIKEGNKKIKKKNV